MAGCSMPRFNDNNGRDVVARYRLYNHCITSVFSSSFCEKLVRWRDVSLLILIFSPATVCVKKDLGIRMPVCVTLLVEQVCVFKKARDIFLYKKQKTYLPRSSPQEPQLLHVLIWWVFFARGFLSLLLAIESTKEQEQRVCSIQGKKWICRCSDDVFFFADLVVSGTTGTRK